jgi:hypothetical protein
MMIEEQKGQDNLLPRKPCKANTSMEHTHNRANMSGDQIDSMQGPSGLTSSFKVKMFYSPWIGQRETGARGLVILERLLRRDQEWRHVAVGIAWAC